jgi:nitroreductase
MASPADRLRPLRATRQVREFTTQPVDRAALDALADVARWSGSSRNSQPWRFIVISDPATIRRLHEIGVPQTRSLNTATAALAIVLPVRGGEDLGMATDVSLAYDDGRVAERLLVAAGLLGLGAGIAWVRAELRGAIGEVLGLPADRFVRTIIALGHPSEAAKQPKSAPGAARLPRSEVVFEERWSGE